MQLREQVRGDAGQLCEGEQSREDSRSTNPGLFQAQVQTLIQANPFRRKLNRQIAELEPALSLRKQTTANCSNRQKIQFCKHEISTQRLYAPSRTSLLTAGRHPHISNRELLGLEILQLAQNKHHQPVLIANFEPNHFPFFQAGCSK
jgi:hypothetical protein